MTVAARLGIGSGMSLAVCGLLVLGAPTGSTAEPRFEIDPRQDLAELAATRRVAIEVDRLDGLYLLDASAVLPVGVEALLGASLDYDRFVDMGMPNLRASRVVSTRPDGQPLHTWSSLRALGWSSQHYLAVGVRRNLRHPGAAGIEWRLVRRQPDWPYEEASAFTRLEGSWYLEPLGPDRVYVRYVLATILDPSIPDSLVSGLVKRQLREGTREVIQVLGREAARRHAARGLRAELLGLRSPTAP